METANGTTSEHIDRIDGDYCIWQSKTGMEFIASKNAEKTFKSQFTSSSLMVYNEITGWDKGSQPSWLGGHKMEKQIIQKQLFDTMIDKVYDYKHEILGTAEKKAAYKEAKKATAEYAEFRGISYNRAAQIAAELC